MQTILKVLNNYFHIFFFWLWGEMQSCLILWLSPFLVVFICKHVYYCVWNLSIFVPRLLSISHCIISDPLSQFEIVHVSSVYLGMRSHDALFGPCFCCALWTLSLFKETTKATLNPLLCLIVGFLSWRVHQTDQP